MSSKLLHDAPLEAESQTVLSLRESHTLLHQSLKPPFPLTIPSPSEYNRLIYALAYGILTEPQLAKIHFTHLAAIVTDGYNLFVTTLINIVNESYLKLLGPSRTQLIWVCSKLVDVSAVGIENLLVSLLRQINGGDFSDGNLWLPMVLIRVFTEKWNWVISEPSILTSALFTYLRLLSDHYRLSGPELDKLKHLEINFCIRVLRECFCSCLKIGRDLIRPLQDLVHIPEFRDLWKDLLYNPSVFQVPGFSDISQIFHSRTSSRYFLLRIRPEMETQLRFLLTHVKWGSQKRYQSWFAKKFLCGPERETIICDLIRFVCCAHHPPNEIIQSDIISRWAVVGWLLKCCRKNHAEANAKLSLFYDWLFFDEEVDNIMNIEPAILLMVHSIPKYMDMTQTLLEFLFLLVDNYDVTRKDIITRGVSASFSAIIRKGVVHSFEALTSCDSLSPLLKERLSTFLPNLESGIVREPSARLPLHPLPFNLPSSSNVERGPPQFRKSGISMRHERNVLHTKAVDSAIRDAAKDSLAHLPANPQPLNLLSPSNVESGPLHFRKVGLSTEHGKNGLHTKAVDAAIPEAIKDASMAHLPATLMPLNLPGPSNVENTPSHFRKLGLSIGHERNGLVTKAVDDAVQEAIRDPLACLPLNPVPMSLPSQCNVESMQPLSTKSGLSVGHKRSGVHAKAAAAAVLKISDNPVSCTIVKSNESQIHIQESSLHDLEAAVKESKERGLGTLEKILFSYAAIDNGEFDAAIGGNSVFSSEALACQITDAFKSNGYTMFTYINCSSIEVDYDDEIQSATSVVIRAFIFSPNERMKDLLLFWTKKGHAVGPRLLSYASRLAYDANVMCGLSNPNDHQKPINHHYHDGGPSNGDALIEGNENNTSEEIDSVKSLLKCHIDGYISFTRSTSKDPPNAIIPITVHAKFIAELVESAFVAYKGFLKISSMKLPLSHVHGIYPTQDGSNSISCNGAKEMDRTLSMMLFSDLKSCCGWRGKRSKSLFSCIFCHLSDLSIAREDFIRLLVDVLDHVDLVSIQFEVGLKRFPIFGEDTKMILDLVRSTCYWDFVEQQKLWGLLISELAVSKVQVENIVLDMCSGFIDMNENSVALEGLLKLLRSCSPTRKLVATIMSLPSAFSNFAAAVLASWVASNRSMFFGYLADLLQNSSNTDDGSLSFRPAAASINRSAIAGLLDFLDKDGMNSSDSLSLVLGSVSEIKAKLAYMMVLHDSS
ncbi:uncharacterized protein LOC131223886 [Magnolia sinica]|uniref:uncharacterized protein LOC131223886 n=1 Tax=Magnolia sinica TaxID=86752 RepID=UPI002657EB6D|nr:uncharacterized protein LOC131223886 [Magnolia sinica]XP_058075408.1 uncharacterized protein LOC131223886 [Magnolia sinica]XP_058075409.1 uncharacterized protein LOC131223886 [Magnolia sinica]XP_058075410.1 uncharacterized protein LOC131223886 [Magnolia sinica]XP_058075411.1 uncharacterized protein LOC131223886 [Magnolia sinica]XP_058075412.1 uncharacterized protein LOC131223886 [Magnolia sinica]XP_058075413.1 uncharacterized protein LOC131223886 [Magnolia sinica]XP_058075414.1 uncharacte